MGDAITDGTFFDFSNAEWLRPADLSELEVIEIQTSDAEVAGKLISKAMEIGNKELVYFMLGIIVTKAEYLTPAQEERLLTRNFTSYEDARELTDQLKRLEILGKYLPSFRPYIEERVQEDSK